MQAVAIAAVLGAGALQAGQQRRAGALMEIEHKEQAQQETDAARDREIERRRRLVSALAAQNAEAGALGAAPGVGSRAAVAIADAKRASYENLADRASTNRRAITLRTGGREARKQGNLQAGATLLSSAAGAYGVS
jgi:hypothetical protein